MKHGSTLFLKGVIILIGLMVLGVCVFVLPGIIGSIELSGYDPILIGMYVSAAPFLFVLYETLRLLNLIDTNQAFSDLSVKALVHIKHSAFLISALYAAGMPYIFQVAEMDDAPGVVAIGLVIIFASFAVGIFATVLQKLLHEALAMKAENDLTV